jgi:hypothetical protein
MKIHPQMPKPEFVIDLSKDATSSLIAQSRLMAIDTSICYHTTRNLRLPLGIYNNSIYRICNKVSKCCKKLEEYFKNANEISILEHKENLKHEIIDYIELSLYAAAEHVDDIRLIAKGFYNCEEEFKKSRPAKLFDKEIKQYKDLISASINAIKHNQSRIRLASIDFTHSNIKMCLHGYFIEGVENGVVCPKCIFNSDKRHLFSITTLIWEIIVFLLHSSNALSKFLESIIPDLVNNNDCKCNIFSKTVIAALRLPLYSFDDIHPFTKTRIIIAVDHDSLESTNSDIYGSFNPKWVLSDDGEAGNFMAGFEGDCVSAEFMFPMPNSINLQHWE